MNASLFFQLIVVSVFLVCYGKSTIINACSENEGILPDDVTIHIGNLNCTSTPCLCIPGCPYGLIIEFVAPKYLEHFKPQINATFAGVEINYPLFEEDACVGVLNTQCPIVEREKVRYKHDMEVYNFFPEVTVNLKFVLIDKDINEPFLCFSWDINVRKIGCPNS